MLTLDPLLMFVGFLASGAGFVLFTYGRKQQRITLVIGGVLLLVYPYFVETVAGLVIVGLLIGAAVWIATRLGW